MSTVGVGLVLNRNCYALINSTHNCTVMPDALHSVCCVQIPFGLLHLWLPPDSHQPRHASCPHFMAEEVAQAVCVPLGLCKPERFKSIPPKWTSKSLLDCHLTQFIQPMVTETIHFKEAVLCGEFMVPHYPLNKGIKKQASTKVGREVALVSVGTLDSCQCQVPLDGIMTNLKRNCKLGKITGKS